jgi:hypothetical protein
MRVAVLWRHASGLAAVTGLAISAAFASAEHVRGQSVTAPRSPGEMTSAREVLEQLRAAWGLPQGQAREGFAPATEEPIPAEFSWVGRPEGDRLLAELPRSVKLLTSASLSEAQRREIKKAAVLAESRVWVAVDGFTRGGSTAQETGEAVISALADYVETLEALLQRNEVEPSNPPQS